MKRLWIVLVAGLNLIAGAQEIDPSIFDGTDISSTAEETDSGASGEAPQEESGETPSGGSGEEAVPPPSTDPSLPGQDPTLPGQDPAQGADGGELPEEGASAGLPEDPSEVSTETGENETAPAPGSPAPEKTEQSRAGEEVQTQDRIAPGQAVDLPWDL